MDHYKLLQPFCSDDETRDKIFTPFTYQNTVCATDGYILAIMPLDKYKGEGLDETSMNIDRVIPNTANSKIYHINVNTIEDILEQIPEYDEVITMDCTECDGIGQVEYTYDSTTNPRRSYSQTLDCPVCDGSGEGEEIKTGNRLHTEKNPIYIEGKNFMPTLLAKITKAARQLECRVIEWISTSKTGYADIAIIDYLQFIIMPNNGITDDQHPIICDVSPVGDVYACPLLIERAEQ